LIFSIRNLEKTWSSTALIGTGRLQTKLGRSGRKAILLTPRPPLLGLRLDSLDVPLWQSPGGQGQHQQGQDITERTTPKDAPEQYPELVRHGQSPPHD